MLRLEGWLKKSMMSTSINFFNPAISEVLHWINRKLLYVHRRLKSPKQYLPIISDGLVFIALHTSMVECTCSRSSCINLHFDRYLTPGPGCFCDILLARAQAGTGKNCPWGGIVTLLPLCQGLRCQYLASKYLWTSQHRGDWNHPSVVCYQRGTAG